MKLNIPYKHRKAARELAAYFMMLLLGAALRYKPFAITSFVTYFVCIFGNFYVRRQLRKDAIAQQTATDNDNDARVPALIAQAQASDFSLPVHTAPKTPRELLVELIIGPALIILLLCFVLIKWTFLGLLLLPLAIGLLVWGTLETLQAMSLGRQSILTLSARGFSSPLYGDLPWDCVANITLEKLSMGRLEPIHRLTITIPDLWYFAPQFRWTSRLLYRLDWRKKHRSRLHFLLINSAVDANTVHLVAYQLWSLSHGMRLTQTSDGQSFLCPFTRARIPLRVE